MIQWFINLSTKAKVVTAIAFVVFGYIVYLSASKAYYKYQYFLEQEKQVLVLEQKYEELLQSKQILQVEFDQLERQKQATEIIYKKSEQQLKTKQDETDNVLGAVNLYSDKQLDSTIRSYKHIKRTKN